MCPEGMEEDAALCYPPCKSGFYGVGPVCWYSCQSPDTVSGGAVCCVDGTTCSDKIKALAFNLPLDIAKAALSGKDAQQIEQDVINAINDLVGFVMPTCSTLIPKKIELNW